MGIDTSKLTLAHSLSQKSLAVLKALTNGASMSRPELEQKTGVFPLLVTVAGLKKNGYLTSSQHGKTTVYTLSRKGMRAAGIEPPSTTSSLPTRLTNNNTGKTYDPKEFMNYGRVGLAIYK